MPQIDPQQADHLSDREFEIAVKRLANNLQFGEDQSPFVGSGVDYVQSRLYFPGDAVKDMDWKVTGRTGRYHIKEYEIPKSMPVNILIDNSASMCVTSQPLSKYALGLQITGALALSAANRQSPVGIITAGQTRFRSPATLSRAKILQATHQLRRFTYVEPTRIADRLDEVSAMIHHRGLIIVISDLHDPEAGSAIKRIGQEHDVMVIHLTDPAEVGTLRAGFVRAVEAESGHAFTASGRSRWKQHLQATENLFKQAGIDHLNLFTNGEIEAPLRRFLKYRGGAFMSER